MLGLICDEINCAEIVDIRKISVPVYYKKVIRNLTNIKRLKSKIYEFCI